MTKPNNHAFRPSPLRFALTLGVLAIGVLPLPAVLGVARESARSLEPNHADREAISGGYYEGLIDGGDASEGSRTELSLRLMGKPTEWMRFQAAGLATNVADDFLQFVLKPNLDRALFGRKFTTNRHGMRDRDYAQAKPPGVFRVALLGSSIDMGWGVADGECYEALLEDWLNAHAELRGVPRRFEVLNFAVAAYGPLQRYAMLGRKVEAFEPDLVLYSATTLDARLLELHLTGLLQRGIDPAYPFLRAAITDAGITAEDVRLDVDRQFVHRDAVKLKVRARFWAILDATLSALAGDCRSMGVPLLIVAIPRAGNADAPSARAAPLARLTGIAERLALPLVDLTASFDRFDPATIEASAWDDHPNALGHRRIFLGLARALVERPELYRALFGRDPAANVEAP